MVEVRQVASDYTIRFEGQMYRTDRDHICARLRAGTVRVESRLNGAAVVRFRERVVSVDRCPQPAKAQTCDWPIGLPGEEPEQV